MFYEVGDTLTYETWGRDKRTVTVTFKSDDIKNSRAGFDGIMADGQTVWGYDDQIVSVSRSSK